MDPRGLGDKDAGDGSCDISSAMGLEEAGAAFLFRFGFAIKRVDSSAAAAPEVRKLTGDILDETVRVTAGRDEIKRAIVVVGSAD